MKVEHWILLGGAGLLVYLVFLRPASQPAAPVDTTSTLATGIGTTAAGIGGIVASFF